MPTGLEKPALGLEEEAPTPDAPLGKWRDATSMKAVTRSCRRGAGSAEGQKEGRPHRSLCLERFQSVSLRPRRGPPLSRAACQTFLFRFSSR